MKHATKDGCPETRGFLLLMRWFCAWLALLGCAMVLAQPTDTVVTLAEAQALLQPVGRASKESSIKLSHRWDEQFPGLAGQASYRISLPATTGTEPRALLFTRVGNQAEVRINGSVVARLGTAGDTRFDAAKTSWLVTVPAALLRADGANVLDVQVHCQPGRWGGLSLVRYGPLSLLEGAQRQQRLWRVSLPVVMASGFVLMGLTALGLWWRQRVPLYGWFAAAALLGVVRHMDRIWPDVPVPWPWLGALVAAAYAAHLTLMFRVAAEMMAVRSARLHHLMVVTLVVSTTLASASFLGQVPILWTAALLLLAPYGLTAAVLVARAAWQRRHQAQGLVMLVVMLLLVAAAVFDFLGVRLGFSQGNLFSVLPLAVFVIAVLVAALVVARYNTTATAYAALNADLADRVQTRENELHQAYAALREGQREQAVQQERQRLMREIHDGVGAHLVLLRNLAAQGQAEPQAIEQQAQMALDELRMAVDSMQPVHGDLSTVLATMRYRLLPRLQAAGLQMQWDVDRLPAVTGLTPQAVLHVHRILLEALSNVLRHAQARQVHVRARAVDTPAPAIVITLQDDGRGLPTASAGAAQGHGLANMQTRATAIGAELSVQAIKPHGTCVTLLWPLPNAVSAAEAAADHSPRGPNPSP